MLVPKLQLKYENQILLPYKNIFLPVVPFYIESTICLKLLAIRIKISKPDKFNKFLHQSEMTLKKRNKVYFEPTRHFTVLNKRKNSFVNKNCSAQFNMGGLVRSSTFLQNSPKIKRLVSLFS